METDRHQRSLRCPALPAASSVRSSSVLLTAKGASRRGHSYCKARGRPLSTAKAQSAGRPSESWSSMQVSKKSVHQGQGTHGSWTACRAKADAARPAVASSMLASLCCSASLAAAYGAKVSSSAFFAQDACIAKPHSGHVVLNSATSWLLLAGDRWR